MTLDIAVVTELYPPHIGGQENRLARFAEGLAARGHRVTVHTTDPTGGTLPTDARQNGVEVLRYLALEGYVHNGSRGLGPLLRYVRATRRRIRDLLAEGATVWVNEMPVVHLRKISDSPRLAIDWCEYPTHWLVDRVARRIPREIPRGTAVSSAVADHLTGLGGPLDLEVLPNAIPVPDGPEPTRRPGEIVVVGRVVAHKNIAPLARAVERLRATGASSYHLTVIGDGPDRAPLERRFRSCDGIRFLGPTPEADKRAAIRRAWVLAIPGLREGFPSVAAEAIASGTPLLCSGSRRNSAGDWVREHDIGAVADGSGPASFVRALRSIDASSWTRWSARCREVRGIFDPARNLGRLEAAFVRWSS